MIFDRKGRLDTGRYDERESTTFLVNWSNYSMFKFDWHAIFKGSVNKTQSRELRVSQDDSKFIKI
jgi:hypothetical protein